MQAASTGSGTTALHGLRVAAKTPAALGPGPTVRGAFRDVHIGPDGYGIVTLIYRANPRAFCGTGATAWMDSVDLRFTTLGVFHDTQAVPLGDMRPVMTVRRSGC